MQHVYHRRLVESSRGRLSFMEEIGARSKRLQNKADAAGWRNLDPQIGESVCLADELKAQIKDGRFDETEYRRNREVSVLTGRALRLAKQLKAIQSRPDIKEVFAQPDEANYHAYLWMLSWAADALEYAGDLGPIRPLLLADGRELTRQLREMRSVPLEDRKFARQKVWVVLHYAHACFYRSYEYGSALDAIGVCLEFVENRLKDDTSFPCFYSRARISAYRAAIQRQLGDWKGARLSYEESVYFIHQRLAQERANAQAMPTRFRQEEIRASYEIAKTLALGIGYCQKAQGLLHDARVNVQTALVMLSPMRDVLRKAYAELLLSSIERAAAGFDMGRLTEVIKSLQEPRSRFAQYHHSIYQSRADYELALAHLCRGNALAAEDNGLANADYATAEDYIRRVLKFSMKAGDWRWEAVAFIVLSRIARGRASILVGAESTADIKAARDFAQQAIDRARKLEQDAALRLDSEVAAGEAFLAAENPSDSDLYQALDHFEEALSRAGRNPILLGVSHLHLADAHLRNNDLRKALAHFDQWKLVQESVDHGVVRAMANALAARLDEMKEPRYIADVRDTLDHRFHEKQLRKFLFNHAVSRGGDVESIAEALGIKRAAYYKWQKEFRSG